MLRSAKLAMVDATKHVPTCMDHLNVPVAQDLYLRLTILAVMVNF